MAASVWIVASNKASRLSSEWLDSRQCSKSDFIPTRSLPPIDRTGNGFHEREIHPDHHVFFDKKCTALRIVHRLS